VNVRMTCINSNKSATTNFRIYIDGVATGTVRSVSSGSTASYEEDITIAADEKIQIYVADGTGADYSGSITAEVMAADSGLLQAGADPTL